MNLFEDRYLPLFNNSGKSDLELEKEIGLPRSIIYDWKNGRNKGYKKYADKLAAYFNVSTDYLLGNESKTEDPATDKQLKFALFGDTEIDDKVLADVKRFARLIQEDNKK